MVKHSINYIYYGALFALLTLFTASSIFHKSDLGGSQFFFFLYALGQISLEITLFVFLGMLIERYLGKLCFSLFIGITFISLFVHFFDFLMDRILDLSVWQALRIFVLDEDLENFFYLLDASGISLWVWFAFFGFIALLPLIGVGLYRLSMRIPEKRPLELSGLHLFQTVLTIPLALFFWDFSASKVIHPDAYTAFVTSLPWKRTFLQPEKSHFSLQKPLRSPEKEGIIRAQIEKDQTELVSRPNIYLFVVESLRKDAITEEVAPHLVRFKRSATHFEQAISGGNASHISWFSIFHSEFPYFWKSKQTSGWTMGSPALALLKKWGYQIHLYTSAQLSYYAMSELLFGKNEHLLDTKQEFLHAPPVTAAQTDAQVLETLKKDIEKNPKLKEGQVFIIFWDCTHFDYTWPKAWKPKFTPFAQEFAYFRAFHSKKTIQSIRNKYHNAVNYMDHLFGSFLDFVPDKNRAIIAFTGDHGEEFFEHGHLFHNSHLTEEQTHVPLFVRFGDQKAGQMPLASQMDLFPSILDHIGGKSYPFLRGSSIFHSHRWPFAVTARFNAGRTPYEFFIHNGTNKLIAQFGNQKNIALSKKLKIISLRTSNDEPVHEENVESWIESEFGGALKRLFD